MEKNKFDLYTISIDKNIDSKNEVDRILENGISKKDIVIAKKNIRIAIIAITEKGKNTAEKIASALKIADVLNANPVITTSTDTNKKGALDVIVSKISGYVENLRESAKLVNSYLVDDKRVGIYFDSDYEIEKDSLNLSGFELIDEKTEIDAISKLDALVSVTDKLRCWVDEIIYNIKKDNEEKEDLIYIKLVPRRIALG